VIRDVMKMKEATPTNDAYTEDACGHDIDLFCANQQGPKLHECLYDHFSLLAPQCQEVEFVDEQAATEDLAFNPIIKKACHNTMKNDCSHADNSVQMFRCLEDIYVKSKKVQDRRGDGAPGAGAAPSSSSSSSKASNTAADSKNSNSQRNNADGGTSMPILPNSLQPANPFFKSGSNWQSSKGKDVGNGKHDAASKHNNNNNNNKQPSSNNKHDDVKKSDNNHGHLRSSNRMLKATTTTTGLGSALKMPSSPNIKMPTSSSSSTSSGGGGGGVISLPMSMPAECATAVGKLILIKNEDYRLSPELVQQCSWETSQYCRAEKVF
jgi:hypothetical protein